MIAAASISVAMLFTAFVFMFSDKGRCRNNNPVFEKYTVSDDAYKAELADQISALGTENIRFTFNGYEKQGNVDYMAVSLQGKSLCADLKLEVKDWKTFEFLKKNGGYSGAELKGLKMDVVRTDGPIRFILSDLKKVID